MSSMAERLRARSEKRPMYTLDESDDEFLLPVPGSKGKKKEDGKRKDEGRKRDKDDDFLETEKIEKFVRDDAVTCFLFLILLSLDLLFCLLF